MYVPVRRLLIVYLSKPKGNFIFETIAYQFRCEHIIHLFNLAWLGLAWLGFGLIFHIFSLYVQYACPPLVLNNANKLLYRWTRVLLVGPIGKLTARQILTTLFPPIQIASINVMKWCCLMQRNMSFFNFMGLCSIYQVNATMYCHYETMNDGTSLGISSITHFMQFVRN